MVFGVWGLGFGVWCLGLGVWGLGFWVLGLGFVGHARGEEFVAAVEGVRVCASKVAVGV